MCGAYFMNLCSNYTIISLHGKGEKNSSLIYQWSTASTKHKIDGKLIDLFVQSAVTFSLQKQHSPQGMTAK